MKIREARFWPKMKFKPIFFQVLWQFFNPKGSLLRAGGRGVWGEFRPPYKFWAKSVRIFSNAHRTRVVMASKVGYVFKLKYQRNKIDKDNTRNSHENGEIR